MKAEYIELLLKRNRLRKREPDINRVKSLLESAATNIKVVKGIVLSEESATVIFRETYESIRQLGDAQWWLLGYEPANEHEVSMEILESMDVSDKVTLNSLSRFKRIRNDINYRGYKATKSQAEDISQFWEKCGKEIAEILQRKIGH